MEQLRTLLDHYPWIRDALYVLGLLAGARLALALARSVAVRAVQAVIQRTRISWDDSLEKRRVFHILAWFAPLLVLSQLGLVFPAQADWISRGVNALSLLVGALALSAILSALNDIYQTLPLSGRRPIKGAVQLVRLFVFIMAGVAILALLLGQSPWGLLSGVGAFTAVLMLVFRDTILSFVGGLRLIGGDLVRRGDWLEVPGFGADGEVIDIALHTVLVQNWDKTIVSIPTFKLVDGAFKNWRGMTDAGGRRIKRSLILDQASVRFADERLLASLRKVERLHDYLEVREREIEEWNGARGVDSSHPLNGRRLTNLGCFRAYVVRYLRENVKLRQDMTFLVRQLEPTAEGLPLEVYVFTNDTAWAAYEDIQSDIFDHLLAALPWFQLRVYQRNQAPDPRTPEVLP
ncbi:mechanosensitive ion channel family protein [Paucidesulfovibrio longus]|uniref:mechanosensitive ion channel family protein n=1 Tax=Paucidesulfovibrio longus TaxID=889 RepID=UPI0003B49785|nr:mechanosensitive ion channel family protein [Paucidesulfovibrio longus]